VSSAPDSPFRTERPQSVELTLISLDEPAPGGIASSLVRASLDRFAIHRVLLLS